MLKYYQKKNTGFTLVETLVALLVFSISAVALLSILSNNVASTDSAKKKFVASYLAQEGIEYMRSMRDTFVLYADLNTDGWGEFRAKILPCDITLTEGCYFDPDKDESGLPYDMFSPSSSPKPITKIWVSECLSGNCPPILYNPITNKYNYDVSGSDSGFTRKIQIEHIDQKEVKITSTIIYNIGSASKEVSFSENLFDWAK